MDTNPHPLATPDAGTAVDPSAVLESVLSEHEYLLVEVQPGDRHHLVELHGALLLHGLGGHVEMVPDVAISLSARTRRARSIARTASRLARGCNHPAQVMALAAEVIATHLHLIDPELQVLAA